MSKIKIPDLTEDTLENIAIMAPYLDEVGQNRVFGMMCGLITNRHIARESDNAEKDHDKKAG